MPLPSQQVQFPFIAGVNESQDQHVRESPALTSAINLRADKQGALRKRRGIAQLAGTGVLAASGWSKVIGYKGEPVFTEGRGVYGYSPTEAAAVLRDDGCPFVCKSEVLSSNEAGDPDIAYGGGHTCIVWTGTGGVTTVTLIDESSGSETLSSQMIGYNPLGSTGGSYPRVCYTNGLFVIAWRGTTTANVHAATVNPTTRAISSITTIITDGSTTGGQNDFGICAHGSNFIVAYAKNIGGSSAVIRVREFTTALAAVGSAADGYGYIDNGTGLLTPHGISVISNAGERVQISVLGSTLSNGVPSEYGLHLEIRNVSTLASTAHYFVDTNNIAPSVSVYEKGGYAGLCRVSSTQTCMIASSWRADTASAVTVRAPFGRSYMVNPTSGALTSSNTHQQWWLHWASQPFVQQSWDTRVYAWAFITAYPLDSTGSYSINSAGGAPSAAQVSLALFDLDPTSTDVSWPNPVPFKPVGHVCPRVAIPPRANTNPARGILSSVASNGAGKYSVVRLRKTAPLQSGVTLITSEVNNASNYGQAELGECLHASSGLGLQYYGRETHELGFLVTPGEPDQAQFLFTAGFGLSAGTYNYVFTYSFVDTRGRMHESAPSAPVAYTTNQVGEVDVRIPSCTSTRRQKISNYFIPYIYISVYRTTAGSAGPYYLVRRTTSVPWSITVWMNDRVSDASLVLEPQLYTGLNGATSAILANVAPPGLRGICAHKSRLFGIDPDGRTIWFTKLTVEGEATGSKWCDEFTIQFDENTELTAIASMDSHLVVFSKDRVWIIDGEGPNDAGLGSDYGQPQLVATDKGCIDPRSVVLTPVGLLFQSATGIQMLSRALESSYIGGPVEDTLAANPTITSAILHPTDTCVIFTAVNGTSGVRLVWDYQFNLWTTDEAFGSGSSATQFYSSDAIGTDVYLVRQNGALCREDTTNYYDSASGVNTWVTATLETSWVKLGGIQGYQRVRRFHLIGDRYTAHNVTVSFGFDYGSSYSLESKLWADNVVGAFAPHQVEHHMAIQKCQAIRVKVFDATPTGGGSVGTGRGASWAAWSLDVGVKKGPAKIPVVQRG